MLFGADDEEALFGIGSIRCINVLVSSPFVLLFPHDTTKHDQQTEDVEEEAVEEMT